MACRKRSEIHELKNEDLQLSRVNLKKKSSKEKKNYLRIGHFSTVLSKNTKYSVSYAEASIF